MTDAHPATNELVLSGTSVSPGMACGKVFHFSQVDLKSLEENRFPVDDVREEISRFEDAVQKSLAQLAGLREFNANEDMVDIASIFQVHVQMLNDRDFLKTIPDLIARDRSNAEFVLANQIRELERRFLSLDNEIIRARLLDVQDVYFRLLRNILDIEHVRTTPLRRMPKSVVLIAERLLPSDIALFDLKKIIGIVLENGSTVSHVSIIAKALGIPVVINVRGITSLCRNESLIVLDAGEGKVILRPSPGTVARFEKKARKEETPHRRSRFSAVQCFTKDGIKIRIEANAGSVAEVRTALETGAEGIGLLRSELFYLSRETPPSVDEETAFYESIMALCGSKPLTVRLLDIGADKTLPYLKSVREENPHLGVRGIRFLLRHPQLMTDHITSLVRACRRRPAKILLPFVSIPREVRETRKIILDICKKEGVPADACPVGIMLEIPAAILLLKNFLPWADFLSIGTNDLVQYSFAACRENSCLEEYRDASLPLILTLITSAVQAAAHVHKDVTVCGEIASTPATAVYLVGSGVRALSVQSGAIKTLCSEISKKSVKECVKATDEVLRE
jgi:phosphoenolpyruvate-protein phosphotransferase